MHVLTFSTLFPNAVEPHHGIFTETSLAQLLDTPALTSTVVAPVPWFPLSGPRFGRYARYARVPQVEQRIGVTVHHPRYLALPKVGMHMAPYLMAMAALPLLRAMIRDGRDFDVIDAHYVYPDGIAAALLARHFNKPLLIKALGTDINLIPRYRLPRRLIRWACGQAAAVGTVCEALRQELIELGVDAAKVHTLRNGVNLDLFHPIERSAVRAELGFDGFTLLSVGHLDERKGHHRTVAALRALPDVRLVIIGRGPEHASLLRQAEEAGVAERVTILEPMPQDQLRRYYNAADALVLASSREGWANVLLESMACGTPVVASNVWGTPEVVASQAAGVLMEANTPEALAAAVNRLRHDYPAHADTRRYAEGFGWDRTTEAHLGLLRQAVAARVGEFNPAPSLALRDSI